MEDYKNSGINEKDPRLERIRKLARDLPDGCVVVNETQLEAEYDFVSAPTIEIERQRYEELVRAETMLDVIVRVAAGPFAYALTDLICCIVGNKFPDKEDGEDK